MFKLTSIVILCSTFAFLASAEPSQHTKDVEFTLFGQDIKSGERMDPGEVHEWIKELNKYYSENDEPNIHREYVEKLVELPYLTGCDEDTFLKFYSLLSQLDNKEFRNIEVYLRDQTIKMAKRCHDELQYEFTREFQAIDGGLREPLERLGDYSGLEISFDQVDDRPLFTKSQLLEGIYRVLEEKSRKIARKEVLTREELKSLLDIHILRACGRLSPDYDQMPLFFIRNYLERGTLKYSSKKWLFIAELCNTIMADEVEIFESINKTIERYHDSPKANLNDIVNEVSKE